MGNIVNISNKYDQNHYVTGTMKSRRVNSPEGQPAEAKGEIRQKDIVSLSKTSKDMQLAKKAVSSAPDIRPEKVNPIKQKIAEDKYEVNAEAVAEKIIGAHINELI